jgi:hypothetical protein
MSYRLHSFNSVDLPTFHDPSWDAGGGPSQDDYLTLPDGSTFNPYGSLNRPSKYPYTRTFAAEIADTTTAGLRTTLEALKALRGTRGPLVRQRVDDSAEHTCQATLLSVGATRGPQNVINLPITLEFNIETPWYGTQHNTPVAIDGTSPDTVVCANGGNAVNRVAIVTLTAGNAAFTALKVTVTGVSEWTYNTSVTAAQALVVDCGKGTVKNNGVAAYAGFVRTANHIVTDLLRLPAGNTSVVITYTGGGAGATVTIDFCDCWE